MYTISRRLCSVGLSCLKVGRKSITTHANEAQSSPLEGVRVLDLTRIVAGPYCTMILGDLGAEIVKIEKPAVGDECRKWGPPFIGKTNESSYFISLNRNKKSICVDITTQPGREIIYNLALKSDVLVENYVPGKLDKLQLGYDHIKNVAPRVIYCSITGYGSEGPYSTRPGYDVIAASMGGLLHITGPRDGQPVKPGVALTDITTALYAHGAIMAALIRRSRTGVGQKIDCNLLASQMATLINIGSNYLNCGKEAQRMGTAHASIVPYEAFPTKDGYFTVGAGSDAQFKDFCNRIGRSDLAMEKKYLTNRGRTENRKELTAILYEVFATKTNAEWCEVFEGSSSPYGPVNNLQEAFTDPQVKALNLVREMNHPVTGTVKVVGPAVQFGDGGNHVRSAPPTLGQHTDEILKEILGYSYEEIEQLRKEEVVQ